MVYNKGFPVYASTLACYYKILYTGNNWAKVNVHFRLPLSLAQLFCERCILESKQEEQNSISYVISEASKYIEKILLCPHTFFFFFFWGVLSVGVNDFNERCWSGWSGDWDPQESWRFSELQDTLNLFWNSWFLALVRKCGSPHMHLN